MSPNEPNGTSNMTRKERRAAERAARKGGNAPSGGSSSEGGSGRGRAAPSMFVVSLVAVVVGLVAIAALVFATGGFDDEAAAVSLPDQAPPAEELRQGRTLVAPDAAPVVVVEAFEDPQCPACAAFTERIEPLLIAEHVANGTASFTFRDFPVFGDDSYLAAAAMHVADAMDGKFWDMHQAIYHNQGEVSRERLADMAELIGLEREAFLTELDDPAYRDLVEAERAMGLALDVNSTPTIVINGEIIRGPDGEIIRGVPTWDDLDAAVRAAAAAADSPPEEPDAAVEAEG